MRALVLVALCAACGDNLAPASPDGGYSSSFDDHDASVFFGEVDVAAPPAPTMPIAGATICLAATTTCATSATDGRFVLPGPGDQAEVVLVATAPDELVTVAATSASITGDRNLGGLITQSATTFAQGAAAFGVDPKFAARGAVLVLAGLYGDGPFALAIDGATTGYLDETYQPDAARTTLSASGGALIYGVAPGEAILLTTMGQCDANGDGWPGPTPGTIRLPIVAGEVTIVHPLCGGP